MEKTDTQVHVEIYSNKNEVYFGADHNNKQIIANAISHSIQIENLGKENSQETIFEIITSIMLSKQNMKELHKYIHKLEEAEKHV